MSLVLTVIVLLAAVVMAVPLVRRLGFGSPLGYLAAGLAIGPSGLGLVTDVGDIAHVSELGVVMLLFLIGLELRPARLWVMRKSVLGLGGSQVVITGAVLAGAGLALGLPWPAAAVAGFSFALSSTAIALPMLAERDLLPTLAGRDSFAILLFQDLAIIPLVAILPLLGDGDPAPRAEAPVLIGVVRAIGAVVVVLIGGRFLIRPVFRAVNAAKTPEIFTAATLLIVVGTAVFVQAAGLSMSLGAFMAGVLLSDSEYRHQVKADIEPFEGLLLGLFFVSVGMAANVSAFLAAPLAILALVAGLVAAKAAIVAALGRVAGHDAGGAVRMAAVLAQGSEFGFVLFGQAVTERVLTAGQADTAMLVVTLSMIATPFLFAAEERWLAPRLVRRASRPFDPIAPIVDPTPPVIICGFGRVGQVVGRVLRLRGIPFTALEQDVAQVDVVRRFGNKVFYGDPTRPDLLRAAGAGTAKVLVVALADPAETLQVVETAQRLFPHLVILVRARNRRHVHRLMDLDVQHIVRETFYSSLHLTEQVLAACGLPPDDARRTVDTFRQHDERVLAEQHAIYRDETRLIQTTRDAARELRALFEADRRSR